MKVSLNIVQQQSTVDFRSISNDEHVKRIGAQLGAVEATEDWAIKYKGIIVVRVVSCDKHPNADKLNVCRIDDGQVVEGVDRGEDGLIQVVCGAPNVAAGMFVAWIPPGETVPSSVDTADPFVLSARELRGVISNGMLASPSELALYDSHDGLLEITETEASKLPRAGDAFSSYFGVDDFIIDCENKMFTHRPDCFGVIGVARELAGINGVAFKSPDWYLEKLQQEQVSSLPFTASNDIQDLVPRFMAQVVDGISIRQSPTQMKANLNRVGIRPINHIVDETNWLMYLTAQPTHAFDYHKIKALSDGDPTIFPRMAKEGEQLTLLNGKTITLTKDDMVIATNTKAVALAGIMGGAETEVDENTTAIIIECATFNMYAVRRSAMRHGIFTDAVTRFNKGQSPLQNDKVLAKLVSNICSESDAQPGIQFDIHDKTIFTKKIVTTTPEFINSRLGSELKSDAIISLLGNVEIETTEENGTLTITAPFWRTDLEYPEDIVEEIGRLHDYDTLPVQLPLRTTQPAARNIMLDQKHTYRQLLSSLGANEVLTYSFVHGDLMRKTGTDPEKWAYHIRNAISPDLQYYRTSIIPSLLEKVHPNTKSDIVRSDDNEFALFEIGKVHVKDHLDDEGLPKEMERLAFVVAADAKTQQKKYGGSAYYLAKKYLKALCGQEANFEPLTDNIYPITAPYTPGRSAVVSINGQVLACIGEFRQSIVKALKLPQFSAGFEIDLSLLNDARTNMKQYTKLPIYPKVQQDITLEVSNEIAYAAVYEVIWEVLTQAEGEDGHFCALGPRDIYADTETANKRYTFRLWISNYQRTLTTQEVHLLLEKVAASAAEKLNAKRI